MLCRFVVANGARLTMGAVCLLILLANGCSRKSEHATASQSRATEPPQTAISDSGYVGDLESTQVAAANPYSDPTPYTPAIDRQPSTSLNQISHPSSAATDAWVEPVAAEGSLSNLRRQTRAAKAAQPGPSIVATNDVEVDAIIAGSGSDTAGEHLSHLPAGSQHEAGHGYATIDVFYATDRAPSPFSLSAFDVSGKKNVFVMLTGAASVFLVFALLAWFRGRKFIAKTSLLMSCVAGSVAVALIVLGQAAIEKHGTTYTGDRADLTRGICKVTVPDSHRRGRVERPSLLRFEFREDQQEHIVLTSAVELSRDDFQRRLSKQVASSEEHDLLVFIHGYNVDFNSAVQRTAQIAVDLPFQGTPVCYSWPSQGKLLGYSVDENNAEWTVTHLKEFLLELATDSGASSISIVAHSMGNRALTAAIQQISWQLDPRLPSVFDRIVLAAPDVDADRFRRDFAPALVNVAKQVTLYASSDDQALVASKQVHGYPRAGESGVNLVVVPGIETVDVSGIDLSLLGHSYYGDNESMLRDLYDVVRQRLPASKRRSLISRGDRQSVYWQLAQNPNAVPAENFQR